MVYRIGDTNVFLKTESAERLRLEAAEARDAQGEHPWSLDLYKAARILDCLVSGAAVVYGEKVWNYVLVPSLLHIFFLVKEGGWVKELKYHLNFFFCRYTRTEPPELIDTIHKPGKFLIGPLMRFIQGKTAKLGTKAWLFLNTILHGFKKGLPTVDLNTVCQAALKHKTRLSAKRDTPGFLLEEVRRTGREIFRGRCKFEEPSDFEVPSVAACTEATRGDGGSLGYLIDKEGGNSLGFDQLLYMGHSDRLGTTREIRCMYLYSDLMKEARAEIGKRGEMMTFVKFILEPLKVRPITAMSVYHNTVFPEIQRQMWRALQTFPQFTLTSDPVGIEKIDWLINQTWKENRKDYPAFCSGDYSGATDSCNMDLSTTLIDTISRDLEVRLLLKHNLSNQIVSYKKSGLEKLPGVPCVPQCPSDFQMTNGQLMGSRFSFPLLCVFNLAIFRYCLEKVEKRVYEISELPVLVNGDDILFRTNSELQARWESVLPLAGLEKSIGKNFVSEQFCTVNSCLFRRIREHRIVPDYCDRVGGKSLGWEVPSSVVPDLGWGPERETYSLTIPEVTIVPYLNMGFVFDERKKPFGLARGEGGLVGMTDEKKITELESFVKLRGSFKEVQSLPEPFRERMESLIRGHRLEIRDSHMSRAMLGFGENRTRIDYLGDIMWSSQANSTILPIQRIYETHLGADLPDLSVSRKWKKVHRLYESKTDSFVFQESVRVSLMRNYSIFKQYYAQEVHFPFLRRKCEGEAVIGTQLLHRICACCQISSHTQE
jgi:hypothetical protein